MSKFKLWVEDANVSQNTQAYNTFVNDRQRESGFQAGEPASSIRVNTALRQSSLITVALMEVIAESDTTHDYTSTLASMKTLIKTGLKSVKVNSASQADYADEAEQANNALLLNNIAADVTYPGDGELGNQFPLGILTITDSRGITKIIPQIKVLDAEHIYHIDSNGNTVIYTEDKTPNEAHYFYNRTFKIQTAMHGFFEFKCNIASISTQASFVLPINTPNNTMGIITFSTTMPGGKIALAAETNAGSVDIIGIYESSGLPAYR